MSKSVYEIVTERVLAEMQNGIIPWQKPWKGGMAKFNRVSKKGYSWLNQMMLPYEGEYASLKQWNELGGSVKAGERGFIVTYWNWLQKADGVNADGTPHIKMIPFLRYYRVWHISQVEGVEPLPESEWKNNIIIQSAEDISGNYFGRECKLIVEPGDEAYYTPVRDEVHVPELKQFNSSEQYYATLFHEMTHSTGHKTRLDRLDSTARFGNEVYSKEELVAEMGSAMLCSTASLDDSKTFKNSVAYIQNWLQVLKNDPKMIVSASSKAEKAVQYILSGAKA